MSGNVATTKPQFKYRLFEPQAGSAEESQVLYAIKSNYWNEGSYVREFEKQFAQLVGAKYCILVPNGALALYLAFSNFPMVSNHNGRKSIYMPNTIVVPDYYGIFAANAVIMNNARLMPAILDVNRNTGSLPKLKKNYYEPIVVHNNGRVTKCSIIEDCCQAITHHTKGAISCYSFHSTKMITCGGIGGAVCCDDKEVFEYMSHVKDHGRPERAQGLPVTDHHEHWGTNLKMSDLLAAFGSVQLGKLPERIANFNRIYKVYRELLGDSVKWLDGTPAWRIDCLVNDAETTVRRLQARGIEAKRFYLPTHRQGFFNQPDEKYPNTMYLYERGIYLPSSPSLTEKDLHFICEMVRQSL